MHRTVTTGAAVAAALLLAGCAAGAAASAPTWVPKPSFSGEGNVGRQPAQPAPQPGVGPSVRPGPAGPSPSGTLDPNVVATKLAAPVGLTLMPDGTALVGERSTGRIVRVQPKPGQPVPTVRTIAGIDATGDGGLLDLALSPNYAQDGLIFAYLTTRTDNRVVDFTLTGPVTPVLTGIPKGSTDNGGRLMFGADGELYVGTGDAGKPSLAANEASLAGKVLRVTDIGKPAAGNPQPSSPVFTRGHHVVDGLCQLDATTDGDSAGSAAPVVEVEADGAGGTDNINVLRPGAFYGWPAGPASAQPTAQPPVGTLPAADGAPGGCAVRDDTLYVTSLDGKALLVAQLSKSSGALSVASFRTTLVNKYGRLRTVVAAPDGALWLTTSNKDGHGKPVADDERVLRIFPSGGGSATSPL